MHIAYYVCACIRDMHLFNPAELSYIFSLEFRAIYKLILLVKLKFFN